MGMITGDSADAERHVDCGSVGIGGFSCEDDRHIDETADAGLDFGGEFVDGYFAGKVFEGFIISPHLHSADNGEIVDGSLNPCAVVHSFRGAPFPR
jgi:hypothetical protein